MRGVSAGCVLCLMAAPVTGAPALYTFDVTAGSVFLNIDGVGSTGAAMGGTFAITIYQSDCHIGESDTFLLEDSYLTNTEEIVLPVLGLTTVHVYPGSARFLDFAPEAPGHIGPGGCANIATDVYAEATVYADGITTWFDTATWAGEFLPFDMIFTTSVVRSDVVTAAMGGMFFYSVGIPEVSLSITVDLIIQVVGTAHVVPDPALGGLTALGLVGACTWLRRRRRA